MSLEIQGKKVARSCQLALAPVAVDTRGSRNALAAVNSAVDRYGQRKVVAEETQITEGYLSKVTSGAQPFPLTLLDRLPRSVALGFIREYGRDLGVRVVEEDAVVIAAERMQEAISEFLRARVCAAAR